MISMIMMKNMTTYIIMMKKYDDLYEDEYGEDELEEIELPSNEFIPEEQDEFLADIQEESAESLVDWYNKYIKTGGK